MKFKSQMKFAFFVAIKHPRVDFFKGQKKLRRTQNGVFPLPVAEFLVQWNVYNSRCVYYHRKGIQLCEKRKQKQMFAEIPRFK